MALVAAETPLLHQQHTHSWHYQKLCAHVFYTPLSLTATPSTLKTWRSLSCSPSSLSVPPFDSFFLSFLSTITKTHLQSRFVSDPNELVYDGEAFTCIWWLTHCAALTLFHAYLTFYLDSSRLNSLKSQTLVPLCICPLSYIVCSVSRKYQVAPV